ncbi:outer membrane protein transport protein [Aliivibrio fischeri]|uniref:OmpP1/FadL family transporter n=1 Tax=Aliivibrio fischeri TaxID=668 RepID=UPI001060DC61|nr:outer membrane protein transport protein [Aliivibrio fischeri]MCE7577592.1 outer membrane protein transport protein [Aliivibrio fischeri]MCE7589871.1 outer membrane protein transport protein [Aliivibrio fischeri]TDM51684.1 long-chain fatty acid transporter [Aliivibrio fischeri]
MKPFFSYSLTASAVLLSFNAFSSGLFLQEATVANAGTTGAGDGVYTESAAAMWTNPATMSYMGESKTTINAMAFDLEMKFNDNNGSEDGKAHSILPSAGAFHTQAITDKLHFGLALGAVGGSSLDYGSDWAGSKLLEDISLTAMQLNPALSYQVNERLSLGAGLQFSWASFEQSMSGITAETDSDWAYGYNLGVMYQVSEQASMGLSYRSKLEHEFNNNISLGNFNPTLSSGMIMPDIVDLSTSYALSKDVNLLSSIQLHRWSHWDSTVLNVNLGHDNVEKPIQRDWDDVWKFAIGADYRLNSDWRLKAGFSYETSPQDDPSMQWVDLPVGEQYRYSVGASTSWDGITMDMFYEYADLGSVDMDRLNVNGTFDGRIHFVGVNFTF